jgi:exosortase
MAEAQTKNRSLLDEVREESVLFWQQMPDKGLFLGLLAAWLALFALLGNSTFGYVDTRSLLVWMYKAYNAPNSEDGHGTLIPLVVLGLLYWKRKELVAVPKAAWAPALGLLGLAMGMHVMGYVIQQPRVSIIALFTGLYALAGLVWGWRFALAIFFPFVLFAFCVPLGTLAEPITVPLRKVSTDIAVVIVRHGLGIPIVREGVQLMDPKGAYSYEVAAACSGIRSLITLLALTTIYGFMTFRRSWKRALMVALALPLAVMGNVARLGTIIVAAQAFGQKAGEWVHDWFGFVTFAMALAVMLGVGHLLREPAPVPAPAAAPPAEPTPST